MWLIASLIVLSSTLVGLFYYYRKQKHQYFAKQGIKGPSPNFLFGNLLDLRKGKFYELLINWQNNFGKVFVYYEGSTPNLVIGDPDLLQEVMIKQFSNFHSRKLFPMQKNPDNEPRASMFIARGKRWKRMRTTINPAFSESKMRKMYFLIGESIESFMNHLEETSDLKGKTIAIQDYLQRLTMDIICKCAFGIDTNSQKNENHPFINALKRFLTGQSFSTKKAALILTFPEIRFALIKLFEYMNMRPADNKDIIYIRNKMTEVINQRKTSKEKHHDLLQMLLDAEVVGTNLLDEENLCPVNNTITASLNNSTEDNGDKTSEDETSNPVENKRKGKPLTSEEIIAQSQLFLFAGYETSSMATSFTLHLLAGNLPVQEKLFAEIQQVFTKIKNPGYQSLELYDQISKLPYLNAVIYEVLRIHPFANTVVSRICLKEEGTTLSNGLYIPANINIIPNAFALHQDPEIWTEYSPEEFVPERFLEISNKDDSEEPSYEFVGPPHPLAWIPFGAGPRNCICQRFAMMVIKTTLAHFLYKYQVEYPDGKIPKLNLRVGATISPIESITMMVKPRN